MSQFSWQNEWRINEIREESFMVRHVMDKTPKWIRFVRKKVPKGLQKTLDGAFGKAFETVFSKGSGIIEKTYDKEEHQKMFRYNEKKMKQQEFTKKSLRRFERQCKRTIYKNLVISFFEGFGLGLVGMGIPDIFLFVSVLLKSIYEIALSYGCSYTSNREKLFILQIISTSLESGNELREKDSFINDMIDVYIEKESKELLEVEQAVDDKLVENQISETANMISAQLLYWKFIQGKSIIGILGGMSDIIYLKRITDYALLKYKRRFLLSHPIVEDV